MTARSIRRALERKQKKAARKADQREALAAVVLPASAETVAPVPAISAARLAANRANALLSSGPATPEGKAKSSLNAVKTGLTGRSVLLSTDDAAAYQRHLAAFHDEYQPVGIREYELVQSIADTLWRLARIPALENAIFAKGRIEFADLFTEQELEAQPLLIDAHTLLVYEKQIRNLHLQEARLVHRREKEAKELLALQAERMSKAGIGKDSATFTESTACSRFDEPVPNGFVFSTLEMDPVSAEAAPPAIVHQAA